MSRDVFRIKAAVPQRALFGSVQSERRDLPSWLREPKGPSPEPRRPPTVPPPGPLGASKVPSRHPPAPPSVPPGRSSAQGNLDARLEAESLAAEMRESWRVPASESPNLSSALEELGQHILALEAERNNLLGTLEREVWPLVRVIVERVLEREISSDHTLAQRLIREGLHALADSSEVSVTLGPGFAESAESLEAVLGDSGTRVRVITDRSLPPYACNVETVLGSVDESLEARLDNVLLEVFPEDQKA
jgi:flagellar biosynthesis/type III secretory pathway protein FliH